MEFKASRREKPTMSQDPLRDFTPVTGEEFRPARGKLVGMFLLGVLMVPAGALMAYAWWHQVELPGGKVLTSKAGIFGLIGIPLGVVIALAAVGFLALAKKLVIGDDCVQLLKGERVAVHIPFQNVAETYAKGESGAGVVGLRLSDRADPATLVPSYTRDRYEIQVMTYGESLDNIHRMLQGRLAKFRGGAAGRS
jgi:hypothetical protein